MHTNRCMLLVPSKQRSKLCEGGNACVVAITETFLLIHHPHVNFIHFSAQGISFAAHAISVSKVRP